MSRALRYLAVSAVGFALAVPTSAFGQAWTRDEGAGYVNLSVTSLSGEEAFGRDGQRRPIIPYSQTIVGLYGELGLVERYLTLTVTGELLRRNELDDLAATQGFGDLQVGLWSGVVEAPFRLTVGGVLGLPTGDDDVQADPGTDQDIQDAAASLPTGDGEVDFTPTIIVGHSFGGQDWPLRHFATARVGYWIRSRGFSDAVTYQLELGTQVPYAFLDRFWFIFRLRGTESLEEASDDSFAGLGDGITFTAVSAELFGRVWSGLGASVGVDTAFRARGIIAGAPLRFTLSYEF